MKSLGLVLLVAAGAVLGWVAYRTPEPSYVVPELQAAEPEQIPLALTRVAQPGDVVRTFDVEGMCCNGCTGKLYRALAEHPSVNAAAVSFEHGTAQVSVAQEFDSTALVDVLTFDKYSAELRPVAE